MLYDSFDVVPDDDYANWRFRLSRLHEGLYVCPIVWGESQNSSLRAACMVLAYAPYDEPGCYCGYEVFLQAMKGGV